MSYTSVSTAMKTSSPSVANDSIAQKLSRKVGLALALMGMMMGLLAPQAGLMARSAHNGLLVSGATDTESVTSSLSGSLVANVSNPSNWSLLPVTTVTFRPSDAQGTSFATHLVINTTSGPLLDALALNFLSLTVGVTAVYVECLDGTPLLLGLDQTCSGATLADQQTRRMRFVSLPGYGLHLYPNFLTNPYVTFQMTESNSAFAPGGSSSRTQEDEKTSDTSGETWVTNMGMQW